MTTSLPADRDSEMIAGLRRRRDASRRLPLLACGCRDPWPCRHLDGPSSDHDTEGAADAARHLLAVGLTPLLRLEYQRALWRRGGVDRQLVSDLHARPGMAA